MRDLRHAIDARKLPYPTRKPKKDLLSTELKDITTGELHTKRNNFKNIISRPFTEIGTTSTWTTVDERYPPEMIDVWDYIDQRGLRRYKYPRPIPRAKLLIIPKELTHVDNELISKARSELVTTLHNFPKITLPYWNVTGKEEIPANYVAVSILFIFINS